MTNSPTILILAAGENSRFFPFNTRTHKTGLEFLGASLMVRTLRDLQEHGFLDVVIVVSPKDAEGQGLSGLVEEQHLDMDIKYVTMQEATGMGDAVLLAREHIKESFAVVLPTFFEAGQTIKQMMESDKEDGVILAQETDHPWQYGILQTEGDRVTNIVEKPERGAEPSNLKAYEVWLLSKAFLPVLEQTTSEQYSFELALAQYFSNHDVGYHVHTSFKLSLKYPWQLFDYQEFFFRSMVSNVNASAQVAPTAVIDDSKGPVVIAAGASIGHATKLLGPCYIGEHAFVGDFCFVRGSSVERNATIGANTELVRSIVMEGSEMHFGYVADSIIGKDVRVAAGMLTANKRHDRQHVRVEVKGEKIDIGRENFGALIGDEAKIGVRTTTMPGVVIGAEAVIYPSKTLYQNVAAQETVK